MNMKQNIFRKVSKKMIQEKKIFRQAKLGQEKQNFTQVDILDFAMELKMQLKFVIKRFEIIQIKKFTC